jgi:ankyrin repeat protein
MCDFLEAFIDGVVKGDESIILYILNLGGAADLINAKDQYGMTGLHWTCASADSEKLVPILLAKGAHIDCEDSKGDSSLTLNRIALIGLHLITDAGRSALHLHAAHGRTYGCACLLHQGADVNKQTADTGSTPLHYAAKYKQPEVAKLLLAYGAKTSIANKSHERPKDLGLSDLTM